MQSIFATALFVAAAAAQYAIDPNSVSNVTRMAWCENQETQCPLICLQTSAASATVEHNDCSWQSLTYSCVCANGLSPNVSEYSQTLPYYICQEWGNQCVSNCNGVSSCQAACRQDHPCGAQNPTRVNTSTISSTMMSTTTTSAAAGVSTDGSGATIYTGFAGAAATTSSGSGSSSHTSGGAATIVRVWAMSAGQTFGLMGVMGALFGGFALLL